MNLLVASAESPHIVVAIQDILMSLVVVIATVELVTAVIVLVTVVLVTVVLEVVVRSVDNQILYGYVHT